MSLGIPSSGGNAAHLSPLPNNQGYFAVPTGVQRLYEWGLFSSALIALGSNFAGLATIRLFSYAQTQQGAGFATSSVSETNMPVGALAPGNETYSVSAISGEILGSVTANAVVAPTMADTRALMRTCVLFWEFGSTTTMCISPLSMIGAGGGIFGMTGDTATPVTQPNNGFGGLWMYQNVVVAIPATQSFAVQAQFGNAGQTTAVTAVAAVVLRVTLFNQARVAIPIA